jgi:hypothetical protein
MRFHSNKEASFFFTSTMRKKYPGTLDIELIKSPFQQKGKCVFTVAPNDRESSHRHTA